MHEQPKRNSETSVFKPIFRLLTDPKSVLEEDDNCPKEKGDFHEDGDFYEGDQNFNDKSSENSNRSDDIDESEEYLENINEEASEFDDEFEKVIAEMHANANLTEIIEEITTPFSMLSDLAVDWFIVNMTNTKPNIPFNMTPVLYAQIPTKYKAVNDEKDHLQIVLSGTAGSVGHYILAHYIAKENVVNIYDSLNDSHLASTARYILSRLYPGKKIKFVKPTTKQPDGSSCGIFAIAYATTILLGEDPATYSFQLNNKTSAVADRTMMLRRHVAKMYTSKKFELFPGYSVNAEETPIENNAQNETKCEECQKGSVQEHQNDDSEENHNEHFEGDQNENCNENKNKYFEESHSENFGRDQNGNFEENQNESSEKTHSENFEEDKNGKYDENENPRENHSKNFVEDRNENSNESHGENFEKDQNENCPNSRSTLVRPFLSVIFMLSLAHFIEF